MRLKKKTQNTSFYNFTSFSFPYAFFFISETGNLTVFKLNYQYICALSYKGLEKVAGNFYEFCCHHLWTLELYISFFPIGLFQTSILELLDFPTMISFLIPCFGLLLSVLIFLLECLGYGKVISSSVAIVSLVWVCCLVFISMEVR